MQVRTAHCLSPVPFVLCGWNGSLRQEGCGLANVAATVAELLELPVPEMWEKSLISHSISRKSGDGAQGKYKFPLVLFGKIYYNILRCLFRTPSDT